MRWLFKRAKAMSWGLLVLGALILAAFAVSITIEGRQFLPLFGVKPLSFTWVMAIFVVWYMVSSVITGRYERTLLRKIEALLTETCDPQSCVAEYEKILPKSTRDMKTYLLMELGSAYLAAGDAEKAWEYLEQVTSFPQRGGRSASYRFVHQSYMLSYSVLTDDLESGGDWLNKMRGILDDSVGIGESVKATLNDHYNTQSHVFNIANGEFEGAETVFLEDFNTGTKKLSKVAAQSRLGKVYLHFDRRDEAKAALEYVIANGNKTRYVEEAKELLGLINQ